MVKAQSHILIIDDDPDVLHTARFILKPQFSQIKTESNPSQLNYLIANEHFDVVLLDMNYTVGSTSGKEGLFWLKHIKENSPQTQVVILTAYGDLKLAVEAMKLGAFDFVVKPWENEKLIATVGAAIKLKQSEEKVQKLQEHKHAINESISSASPGIIGDSNEMQMVLKQINKVAATEANVLILGENGTGKEIVAQEIHQQSLRLKESFIKIDLGSLSESLFESELFGHKQGAFTDAKADRIGRIALANSGTLFLDEIGNLTRAMQSKLLSVLQNREVLPVGANQPIAVDVRLVCATNQPLKEMVKQGEFREDLLYRINTVEITLPTLRERLDDIPLLLQHFISSYAKKYRKPKLRQSKELVAHLQKYHWPGNVREIQHSVERAVIMCETDVLQPVDFVLAKQDIQMDTNQMNLDELERLAVERAIKQHRGNMSKAAKELGIGRTTLYRKMEKHNIQYWE